MPKYRVTDPQTGKSFQLIGDSPPTEEELNQIFSSSAGPTTSQEATPVKQSRLMDQIIGGVKGFGNILLPATKAFGEQIGAGLSMGVGGANTTNEITAQRTSNQVKSWMQQAQAETDPIRKKALLNAARSLSQTGGEAVQESVTGAEQTLNLQPGQQLADPLRTGGAFALEVGANLAPTSKAGMTPSPTDPTKLVAGAGATNFLKRVLGAAAGGGVRGLATGASEGLLKSDSSGEDILNRALGRGATSAVISGGLQAGAEGIAKGIEKLSGPFKEASRAYSLRAIRPSKTQMNQFTEKTGKNLEDFVLDTGLINKSIDDVDEVIKPLQDQFDDIAVKSGAQVPLKSVTDKLDKVSNSMRSIATPETQKIADQIDDTRNIFLQKHGGGMSLAEIKAILNKDPGFKQAVDPNITLDVGELTKLRRQIDTLVKEGSFRTNNPLDWTTNRHYRNALQGAVRDATKNITTPDGKNLTQLGAELSDLYSLQDIVNQQVNLGKGNLPLGFYKILAGTGVGTTAGISSAVSGKDPVTSIKNALIGGLAGMGLTAIANNPTVITAVTKALSKAASSSQVGGQKLSEFVTSPQGRRLIEQIGVTLSGAGEEKPAESEQSKAIQKLKNSGVLANATKSANTNMRSQP